MTHDPFQGPAAPASGGLLAVLQFGDSLFPSGVSAFSSGLESLHLDGQAQGAEDVLAILHTLVGQRWAGFDRALLLAAHAAASDAADDDALQAVQHIDLLCEAMTLNKGHRVALRRLGFTQLKVHAELGLAAAATYLDRVREDAAPGTLPVMQGLVWRALGLSAREAESLSVFGLCSSVVGAAMRLGLLGHLDSQRLLLRVRPSIERVLATPAPPLDAAWSGAPALDIAAMRHEARTARLFAN